MAFAWVYFVGEALDLPGGVGVSSHGVRGFPSPEDQIRYTKCLCVCRRYTMSCEYKSDWRCVPWLSRASETREKSLQS